MILEVQGIEKRFGGLAALAGVSLQVRHGEIFGLIGPNGAGKTTMLNVVTGVYKPTAGIVRFKGDTITGLSPEQICRKGIARTFQICQPFPNMSAMDNVMVGLVFGCSTVRAADCVAKAEELLDFVQFGMPKETLAKRLNAGQLKRLDLARALATNPEVLLLDEIAAGLTPTELQESIELVRRIRDRGVTVVIVEHLMRIIMKVCDRIAVIHYGQKIAEGSPSEIKENAKVAEAYLGEKYML